MNTTSTPQTAEKNERDDQSASQHERRLGRVELQSPVPISDEILADLMKRTEDLGLKVEHTKRCVRDNYGNDYIVEIQAFYWRPTDLQWTLFGNGIIDTYHYQYNMGYFMSKEF